MSRIYICNTYYQVYIAIIKEMVLAKAENHIKSDLMLTDVSTDFKDLHQRVENISLFNAVIDLHQPAHWELAPKEYKSKDRGNLVQKLIASISYSLKVTKEIEKYVEFDFSVYDEIYMFNDADPLGFYFYKHDIPYIGIEDSLDLYKRNLLGERRRFFWLRKLLFRLHLLYIPCAMGKNALKVEVNDAQGIICIAKSKLEEVPRKLLIDSLSQQEKNTLYEVFEDKHGDEFVDRNQKTALIIAQCLYPADVPTLECQKRIYQSIIDDYKDEYRVYIKPHPRDQLDYESAFPGIGLLGKFYPIEILNLQDRLHFTKAITVFSTAINGVEIADEKVIYGKEYIERFK